MWLTWRLQRFETALVAGALALAAGTLVPLGLHMASVYDSAGVGGCLAHGGSGCSATVESFRHRFEHAGAIIPWLNFLPGFTNCRPNCRASRSTFSRLRRARRPSDATFLAGCVESFLGEPKKALGRTMLAGVTGDAE